MLNMQNRIMELQHQRIANGEGIAGKKAAKKNPWLKALKLARKDRKINLRNPADVAFVKKYYYKSGSKTQKLKKLGPRQKKAAVKRKNVCYNYEAKNPKYWQDKNDCITIAQHNKNKKKKAVKKPVKKQGSKTNRRMKGKGYDYSSSDEETYGGCCQYCKGLGYIDEKY